MKVKSQECFISDSNIQLMKIADDITALIGNTPLVKLNKITKDTPVNVVAKLEFLN